MSFYQKGVAWGEWSTKTICRLDETTLDKKTEKATCPWSSCDHPYQLQVEFDVSDFDWRSVTKETIRSQVCC